MGRTGETAGVGATGALGSTPGGRTGGKGGGGATAGNEGGGIRAARGPRAMREGATGGTNRIEAIGADTDAGRPNGTSPWPLTHSDLRNRHANSHGGDSDKLHVWASNRIVIQMFAPQRHRPEATDP